MTPWILIIALNEHQGPGFETLAFAVLLSAFSLNCLEVLIREAYHYESAPATSGASGAVIGLWMEQASQGRSLHPETMLVGSTIVM
jgi:hypothetical protein